MAKPSIVVNLRTHTRPTYEQQVLGKESPLSADLDEFRGIPFGVVPGRWQHSYVRDKLPKDVYSAINNGPKCPQSPEENNSNNWQSYVEFPADVTESEIDCLNLFVIRPSVAALTRIGWDHTKKLPVLLWIHGGGYAFGAGTDPMWDPSRLVLQSIAFGTPIIVVNINYRLGIFGFAASSDIIQGQPVTGIRGCNFGIRDQKVGIKWVSQNIGAFGGDSTKITLGGQSAGGSSVHAHVLEAKLKAEEPLFRHACIQSGAVGTLGPLTMAQADAHWEVLCQHLGIEKTQEKSRVEFLQSLTTEALMQAAHDLEWKTYALVWDNLTMRITGDLGDHGIPFAFNFGEVGSNGEETRSCSNGIRILIGDTDVDGSVFSHRVAAIHNFAELQVIFMEAYACESMTEKVLTSYGITPEISKDRLSNGIINFLTDTTFTYPIDCARNSLIIQQPSTRNLENRELPGVHQRTTVQSYRIKFGNPFPGPCYEVAQHCVELIYLFDAFHDHMMRVDTDYLSSRRTDCSSPVAHSPLCASTDSGYLSAADEVLTNDNKGPSVSLDEMPVSNATLRETLQRQWISFITDDQSDVLDSQKGEKTITIYGKDRRVTVESLTSDREWVEQQSRFKILAANWKGATAASKRITGAVLM